MFNGPTKVVTLVGSIVFHSASPIGWELVSVEDDGGGAGNRIVAGATKRDPTGAKVAIGDDAKATIGPDGVRLIPPEDDSRTIPTTVRRALAAALERAADDAIAAGDVAVARIALSTLAALAQLAG